MLQSKLLSPEQAQRLVEELLNQYGLGAIPQIRVARLADGDWQIKYNSVTHVHAPMNEVEWHAWLESKFGPDLKEKLATLEG
jgi:hypothetical protein